MTDRDELLSTDLFYNVLSCLDTATLIQNKAVCKEWRDTCCTIISRKAPRPRQSFQTQKELREAVNKYCACRSCPDDAEMIAVTYGWPIGSWDVSNFTSMESLFFAILHSMKTLAHGMYRMSPI